MSSSRLLRWSGHSLVEIDDPADHVLEVADSWLVSDGRAFAIEMHRARFQEAVNTESVGRNPMSVGDVDAFWSAVLAAIPASGLWFPRVELRSNAGRTHLTYRHRLAPELTRAVTLRTFAGPDPRRKPSVKGPDLEKLLQAQTLAQQHGVDEIVILTPDGNIIDGATNAFVWWRGDSLCAPPSQTDDHAFARVPSVTAASLLGLAGALGVETRAERATPADLAGCEVWALNALHGIRMVTGWVGGPQLAEKPGRIGAWRHRREALRVPIGDLAQ
jgi:branched-subunit amino acid aminotransferase/4-amino-4-deoxychorismate lyase